MTQPLVPITKYRYKVLRGEVAKRARDLLRQIYAAREVRILRGAVSPDHIHMLVVAPPQLAPAKLVQFLKGRSSRLLQQEFPHLRKRHWGQHLWARGYFCAAVERGRREDGDAIHGIANGIRTMKGSKSRRPTLSRLSAGAASGGFSCKPTFSRNRRLPALAGRRFNEETDGASEGGELQTLMREHFGAVA